MLIYGEAGPGNAAEQLAMQAGAVRGFAKVLKPTTGKTCAGYEVMFNNLRKRVADVCTQALLDDDRAFFARVGRAMRKVDTQLPIRRVDHFIRLLLLHEAKAGPVNLSQFAVGLEHFRGIRTNARSLGRIAHKLGIPIAPRGRPKKSDK